MIFPEKFITGETVQYPGDGEYLTLNDYPAGTWTMSVTAVGPVKLSSNASASGTGHNFEIDTSSLTAGFYTYQAKVTDGSDTHYLDDYSGTFEVSAALADQSAGYDARSHAQTMLDAIESLLEGRATREHKSISHNGRTLQKHSFDELMRLRNYYRGEIARANIKKRGTFKNIGVRF